MIKVDRACRSAPYEPVGIEQEGYDAPVVPPQPVGIRIDQRFFRHKLLPSDAASQVIQRHPASIHGLPPTASNSRRNHAWGGLSVWQDSRGRTGCIRRSRRSCRAECRKDKRTLQPLAIPANIAPASSPPLISRSSRLSECTLAAGRVKRLPDALLSKKASGRGDQVGCVPLGPTIKRSDVPSST